ncbi:hypothetical protein HPP92_021345 [Vanilla planifolia]|nr:hypothetical protein HPP92_021345 [Vanilla planifolia]
MMPRRGLRWVVQAAQNSDLARHEADALESPAPAPQPSEPPAEKPKSPKEGTGFPESGLVDFSNWALRGFQPTVILTAVTTVINRLLLLGDEMIGPRGSEGDRQGMLSAPAVCGRRRRGFGEEAFSDETVEGGRITAGQVSAAVTDLVVAVFCLVSVESSPF